MVDDARQCRVEVVAGGDPLRQERWTRSLRDDLAQFDDISVEFARDTPTVPGSKGGLSPELALMVAAVGSSVAKVLITAITEWCRKERHRKVRVTRGDVEVEITGDADQHQRARELVNTVEDDA